MDTQFLQIVCNVIVLLGATATALMAIMALIGKLIGKPVGFFRKRREHIEKERRQEIVGEVTKAVEQGLGSKLDEIYQQNLEQNEDIATLTHAMRNSIGAEILGFYESHKNTRVITESEKDALEELYKSYKYVKGNHYVDKIYDRITTWTVVTEDGIEVHNVTWWHLPK